MTSKTEAAIHYLVCKHDGELGRTALVKLLYLLDLDARRFLGHPVTDFTWQFYDHGPFPAGGEFYLHRDVLTLRGAIREEERLPDDANLCYRYWDTGQVKPSLESLTPGERALLEAVNRRYGKLGLCRLLEEAYASDPMQDAERYSALPMEVVDNQRPPEAHGIDFEALAEGIEQYKHGELVPGEEVERELLARLHATG